MMVVMVVMIPAVSRGNHNDAGFIISAIEAVMMMMMMVVVIKLHLLNVFISGGDRTGLIDNLEQSHRVRNRLKQVGE